MGSHAQDEIIRYWKERALTTEKQLAAVRGLPEKWRDRYNREVNLTGFRADELIDCADQLKEAMK